MNIKESAKAYAEGKAVNALTAAIEQAYADGYNAGFNDGLASKKDELPADLDDGVEYVDLGLPSGTKWAAKYLEDKDGSTAYLTYDEAAKLNIPTKEQYDELIQYCVRNNIQGGNSISGQRMIGRNGNYVDYEYKCKKVGPSLEYLGKVRFWIKDKKENEDECGDKRKLSDIYDTKNISPVSDFMGYGHPVILVR